MKSTWRTLRGRILCEPALRARRNCAGALCLLATALGLTGCVFGEESESPVLTVYLYWEYDNRTDNDGSCHSVPVAVSEWRLLNSQGELLAELPRDQGECDDQINFHNLDFGSYDLEVVGYDEAGEKGWEGTCHFQLRERFDRVTDCSIYPVDS